MPIPRLNPLVILSTLVISAFADEFTYQPPVVKKAIFMGDEIALLESERERLASNIAGYVSNSLSSRPHPRELRVARQLIGLSLHLNSRDRNALVANRQLERGLVPKKVEVDYQPEVLAELLLARARTLLGGDSDLDQVLAGFFLFVAMEADPENEDAVYDYEIYRLDHGDPDWDAVTGVSSALQADE
ncbi:MAG: hypothetical protein AAGJ79_02555 [Verrucomicrobiota bacterium]